VRVHAFSAFDDLLGRAGARKRTLQRAMDEIGREGAGVIVLLFPSADSDPVRGGAPGGHGLARLWHRRPDPGGPASMTWCCSPIPTIRLSRSKAMASTSWANARSCGVSLLAKFLIVEARFYDHLNDQLIAGARAALKAAGHKADVVTVPGALEIPAAIALAEGRQL
jgi:hypothetical protein